MKRFIIYTVIFLTIVLIAILALFLLENKIIRKKSNFILPDNISMVMIGHSIPECAYNDKEIENFKNYANSGESYFYSYPKIRYLLESNPQIKTVFIEFTNNQLSKERDMWIWGDLYMNHKFPRLSPFLLLNDHLLLMRKNTSAYLGAVSVSFKHNAKVILKKDNDFINQMGGYKLLYRKNSVDTIALDSSLSESFVDCDFSFYNLLYLRKSVDYCLQKGVNVIFVKSPLHPHFKIASSNDKLIKILETQFPDVELLNFHDFPLAKDEYADMQHLNYFGAVKFSKWFNNLLENGLLEKQNKQEFIDEMLREYKANLYSKVNTEI